MEIRRGFRLAAALALTAAALVAAGCGGGDDGEGAGADTATSAEAGGDATPPDQPVKIRMGWFTPGEEIKYLMMERPALAPSLGTWYDLEWVQFSGVGPGVQALAAGTVDATTCSPLAAANAIEQGATILITAQTITETEAFSTTYVTPKDSGVTKPADMKGKVRATSNIGGTSYYAARIELERAGLEENRDYKLVEIPYPIMQEALLADRAAMGELASVFLVQARNTGKFRELFSIYDVLGETPVLILCWNGDFLEENRASVQRFMADWNAVQEWVTDPANRDEVVRVSAKTTELPVELLDSFLLIEGKDYVLAEGGAVDLERLQANWDFFRKVGGIKRDLRAQDYVVEDLFPVNAAEE